MSPFIVSSLNSNGSVFMLDTQTIDAVNGSQAYTQGLVVGTLDAVNTSTDPFMNGARYRADGALRLYDATSALPAQVYYDNGIAFTSSGQMCITLGAVSNPVYISGMAVRSDGAVYATPASFYLPLTDAGKGAVNTTAWGKGASQTATFTRATIATTFNSAGTLIQVASGVPRSYYDPTTLQYRRYLPEPQRTNFCLQSNAFDTTWANTRSSDALTGGVTAPDGGASSWKLIEDNTAANSHLISQTVTYTAAVHTFSVFVKAAERSAVLLQIFDGTTTSNGNFNLATGVVGTTSNATSSIQALPNGWYRCSITTNAATAAAAGSVTITIQNPLGTNLYNGDNVSGLYVFGAQLEAGAFPTTYIPTTTASVTRNADVLTYPASGNIGAVGTIYCQTRYLQAASGNRPSVFVYTDANNYGYLFSANSTGLIFWQVVNGGAIQANINSGVVASTSVNQKHAARFGTNDFAVCVNGSTPVTDVSGTVPAFSTIGIGRGSLFGESLAGCVGPVYIFPSAMNNAQLQAITT